MDNTPKRKQPAEPGDSTGIYKLRLYVAGASPNSTRAMNNIRKICDQYLAGNYRLEIIDIYQQKGVAKEQQIIALPLLVKLAPYPERRLIGDLSETEKVLTALSISR